MKEGRGGWDDDVVWRRSVSWRVPCGCRGLAVEQLYASVLSKATKIPAVDVEMLAGLGEADGLVQPRRGTAGQRGQ